MRLGFWWLQDLCRRLDMHHDELNRQRGRLQAVADPTGRMMRDMDFADALHSDKSRGGKEGE